MTTHEAIFATMTFRAYRKFVYTTGRFATSADVEQYGGIVHGREKDNILEEGDFLAEDALGEWWW